MACSTPFLACVFLSPLFLLLPLPLPPLSLHPLLGTGAAAFLSISFSVWFRGFGVNRFSPPLLPSSPLPFLAILLLILRLCFLLRGDRQLRFLGEVDMHSLSWRSETKETQGKTKKNKETEALEAGTLEKPFFFFIKNKDSREDPSEGTTSSSSSPPSSGTP